MSRIVLNLALFALLLPMGLIAQSQQVIDVVSADPSGMTSRLNCPSTIGMYGASQVNQGDTCWYVAFMKISPSVAPSGTMGCVGGTIVPSLTSGGNMNNGPYPWTAYSYGVVWNSPGTGHMIFNFCNNLSGCCDTLYKAVNIGPPANVHAPIIGPEVVCERDTAVYSTFAEPNFSYNWDVTGGILLSGQGTPQITVDWFDFTDWYDGGMVTLTKRNGALGTSSIQYIYTSGFNMYGNRPPVVYGPEITCGGAVQKYHASFQGDIYNWSVGGGTLLSGQGTDTIVVQWPSIGNGQGTVSFTGEIQSNPNCNLPTFSRSLAVSYPSLAYPMIVAPNTAPVNTPTTYSTLFNPGHTYNWSVSGGTILSGQSTNQILVQWNSTGPQSLFLTETNPVCGPSSQSFSVNVQGLSANILATDTLLYVYGSNTSCSQLSVQLNPVPTNPSFLWSTGDTSPSITVCPGNTSTYSVTVSDAQLGIDSDTLAITVLPAPTCNGGSGIQVCRTLGAFTFTQCVPIFSLSTYLAQGAILGPCSNKNASWQTVEAQPILHVQSDPIASQFEITVQLPATQTIAIRMTDLHGKLVKKIFNGRIQQTEPMKFSLEREGLAAGLYFIQLQTEQQGTITKKILLQ